MHGNLRSVFIFRAAYHMVQFGDEAVGLKISSEIWRESLNTGLPKWSDR